MLADAVLVAAMLSQQEESKYVTALKHEAGKASREGSHAAAAADSLRADGCYVCIYLGLVYKFVELVGVGHCRLHSLSHPRAFASTAVDDAFSSRPFHEIETLQIRWSTLPTTTTLFAICIRRRRLPPSSCMTFRRSSPSRRVSAQRLLSQPYGLSATKRTRCL